MLDDVIDIQISVSDRAPARPNFGTPLIAAFHEAWGDRVREYSRADDLLEDGFLTSDSVYQIASAIKRQNPTIRRFKVGRLEEATYTHTVHLIPANETPGYTYSGTVEGTEITFDVGAEDDVEAICDTLTPLVDAITGVSATDAATHVVVEADDPGKILQIAFDRGMRVLDATAVDGEDLAADLAEIEDEDPAWYGLLLDVNSEDSISAAAGWIEGRRKIFFTQSADWNVADGSETTDIGSVLKAQTYTRTFPIWHRFIGGSEWANGAYATVVLGPDVGSSIASYKSLAGITVDNLRAGEQSGLKAKHWTQYQTLGGLNLTLGGRSPSGRYVDLVRGVDWLHSEMQLDILALFANNPKVPFTANGLALIKGTLENAIVKGIRRGLVADDTPYTVTVPTIDETDASDRLERILRGCEFTARVSGAVESVTVRGNLTI